MVVIRTSRTFDPHDFGNREGDQYWWLNVYFRFEMTILAYRFHTEKRQLSIDFTFQCELQGWMRVVEGIRKTSADDKLHLVVVVINKTIVNWSQVVVDY